MPALIVVGAQWGDEGKGKLVDYITSKADYVVRYAGGSNAGHTLVVDGLTVKLSLVPSGILRANTKCLIATGVVVNPSTFISELNTLAQAGIKVTPERLMIDEAAQLVLPYHECIDKEREVRKGKDKIGTTGRGIGPAYEDRAARCGVMCAELRDLPRLREKLVAIVDERNAYLKNVLNSQESIKLADIQQLIERAARELIPFLGNVGLTVDQALRAGDQVVFEGAQGTLLDQMHGTVPFVTSSTTIAAGASVGTGIGPRRIDYVLGVAKAYSTRVGSGPFPTELHDQLGEQIRKRGAEFGTLTGRARRCGWLDMVALKRAVRLNGIDSLALTKLDVLSGVEKLKVCIKYTLKGKELEDLPVLAHELEQVEPKYIELDGWQEDLSQVTKWHELPASTRLYLSTISEILGCPVSIVSVGAERHSTIFSSSAGILRNFVG